MTIKCIVLFIIIGFCFSESKSQVNIPLGTWRVHLSYNELNKLIVSDDQIFGASDVGIVMFDRTDNEIASLTKIDGLNSSVITALGYDQQRNLLLIGHQSGLISLLDNNELSVINNLVVASSITGSRKINHILVYNNVAYLSTDFGVVVLDIDKKEVKETYRDLGDTGDMFKINSSLVFMDSIFLATENGIISGSLSGASNLLDFRNWSRYNQGSLNNNVNLLTVFEGALYAAIDVDGIFKLQNGAWQLQSYLQGETYHHLSSNESNLLISTANQIWKYTGGLLLEIGMGAIKNPNEAYEDDNSIWVADGEYGLLKIDGIDVTSYKPNGPSSNYPWKISYTGNAVTLMHGGFSSTIQPLDRVRPIDQFVNGQWKQIISLTNSDVTDFEELAGKTYISSFGSGLERIDNEGSLVFNDSNSPLSKINPSDAFVPVTSIEKSNDGLWVANYGLSTPLHLFSNDMIWQSFSFTEPQASYPVDLLVDQSDKTWMIIDPSKGGGLVVFEKATNSSTYLTTQAGKGGLPSASVRSISSDRSGQVWVGTDAGVIFYPASANIFGTNVDPTKPVFENRFLLRDESVTAIAIDGGNRKWLGTNNGVWLFGPTGEELIYNLTEENSPLLSNKIVDIAINPINGEVFFSTDKGLVSFRSDATESDLKFDEVKIFPNPVSNEFNGQVAIEGLYRDAIVKITDLSGRMVWQTQANGGTATWNARQLNGNRVSTGMYLVFATSSDGTERHVGKIAVVE